MGAILSGGRWVSHDLHHYMASLSHNELTISQQRFCKWLGAEKEAFSEPLLDYFTDPYNVSLSRDE